MKKSAAIFILFVTAIMQFHCRSMAPDREGMKPGAEKNIRISGTIRHDLPTYYITTRDAFPRMGSLSVVLVYVDRDGLTDEIRKKGGDISAAIDEILRKKAYADLDSREDIDRLSGEIKEKVNGLLEAGKIDKVELGNIVIE